MASKSLCRTCLANLHQQVRSNHYRPLTSTILQARQINPHRTLPTIRTYTATATGNPPAPGHLELPESAPAGAKVANAAREEGSAIFEQYVAQGATEALFKECASQADYIIPQAFDRKNTIPKSTTGEDLGEGSGWWYESTLRASGQ